MTMLGRGPWVIAVALSDGRRSRSASVISGMSSRCLVRVRVRVRVRARVRVRVRD